ncbi:MAG: FKBP-type peptidyl-prolyl cis-trans isomerase [bacterium]
MSLRTLLIVSASLLALAACGKKTQDTADTTEIPTVQEAEQVVSKTAEELAAEARAKNENFLKENAKKEGVEVTQSGLQYLQTQEGEGAIPGEDDFARFHFEARTIGGKVVSSSYEAEEPVTVLISNLIPGWREGLTKMHEGSKAEVILPPELMLIDGQTIDDPSAPKEAMIFDFEMLEVIKPENTDRLQEIQTGVETRARARFEALKKSKLEAAQNYLDENKTRDGVQVTESGLQYKVLNKGAGNVSPKPTDEVEVHYRGTLTDGKEFDSSYKTGKSVSFYLNQVIPGWTEGLQLMHEGDKFRFFIPPEIGYGELGTPGGPIGPNEVLVFDVELVDIKDKADEAKAAE